MIIHIKGTFHKIVKSNGVSMSNKNTTFNTIVSASAAINQPQVWPLSPISRVSFFHDLKKSRTDSLPLGKAWVLFSALRRIVPCCPVEGLSKGLRAVLFYFVSAGNFTEPFTRTPSILKKIPLEKQCHKPYLINTAATCEQARKLGSKWLLRASVQWRCPSSAASGILRPRSVDNGS